MTELYAVKHVADRVANEPRNVGVIAATGRGADSRVATRFLGVDLDGTSARRPLSRVPKNIYLAWVNYFRVKTREDRWEDIARARQAGAQGAARPGGGTFKGGRAGAVSLRGRVIGLEFAGRALVPAAGGPGVVDKVPDGDDSVGQGGEFLDHPGARLDVDLEPVEAAGVPGAGALDHPSLTGLQRGVPGGDPGIAAQRLEQFTGLSAVVAGAGVHGDALGQVEAESVQAL